MARRHLAIRTAATLACAVLAVLVPVQMAELRGELAFARFLRLEKLASGSLDARQFTTVVGASFPEASLVMRLADRDADALWDVSRIYLRWARDGRLDPRVSWRLRDRAVGLAVLAVKAAPADFLHWLRLSNALAANGLPQPAEFCRSRAADLAPAGSRLAAEGASD